MTREEAIFILERDNPNNIAIRTGFESLYDQRKEAFSMAIKALDQEPTTKNDLGVDREDAVERLNALKQFIGYDKDSEIVKAIQKSLDMAISALEHPERNVVAVVPCGDAVSRAEVLKLMKDNWHTHNGDWAMQESMDDIRVLPSVTPQEPTDKNFTKADIDAIVKAINSEWELRINEVLDKIRAEIDKLYEREGSSFDRLNALDELKEFIDKYKAETEEI